MMLATRGSLIVALLADLGPIPGWAAPQISGLWGSRKNGSAVVITGTGFGTHGKVGLLATPDAYVVDADSLRVRPPGVLANDRDSNDFSLNAELVSAPAAGLLQLHLDGSFLYIPELAFGGTDTFTYKASNDHGDTATATVTLAVRRHELVFKEAQTGGSSASRTVATLEPIGASPGDLYVVAIATKPYSAATALTGLGTSWASVRAQCSGRGQTGVEVWVGRHARTAGNVFASFATAPLNAVIVACRYSGTDIDLPLGEVVSGNTNGVQGTCSGGSDAARYTFSLTPGASGGLVFAAVSIGNLVSTPALGYQKRAEARAGSGGDQASMEVMDRAAQGTVSIDGTLSSATDWAVIGLEIRPVSQTSRRDR